MKVTLKNRYLTVVANTKGAELNSIKNEDHIEYLWQADSEFWGWHAPVLFPIVGRLVNDQYEYRGRHYSMKQHGFARHRQFKIRAQTRQRVVFELDADRLTRQNYPFAFKLLVSYRLVEHTIQFRIWVVNASTGELWFSTGAHPGFNLPLMRDGSHFSDYQLTVSPRKRYPRIILRDSLNDIQHPTTIDLTRPLPLDHRLFNHDAIVLALHHRQTTLMFSTSRNDHGVAVTVYHCPYVGIWSSNPNWGPFACFEPWWGLADNYYHHGSLVHKTAINHLAPGQTFRAHFDITIF